jgi:molybdopterin biosynthesis enzyme
VSTGLAPHEPPPEADASAHSRYERAWATVALCGASVWIVVAVLQTPRLPLLGLVVGLGAAGGMLVTRASISTPGGRSQYVRGALAAGGLVLVAVGMGHHLTLGLAGAACLAVTSPAVLRWVAGR